VLRLAALLELFHLFSNMRVSYREAEDYNSGGDIQGASGALRSSAKMFRRSGPIRKE
jgi:hypothetical protein